MRVLMFGWEFPPHISGGLGTACYGLTKGLHSVGVNDIIFVVPKAYGDEDTSKVNIIDAGEIVVSDRIIDYSTFFQKMHFIEVGTSLSLTQRLKSMKNLPKRTGRNRNILYNRPFQEN